MRKEGHATARIFFFVSKEAGILSYSVILLNSMLSQPLLKQYIDSWELNLRLILSSQCVWNQVGELSVA